MFNHIGADNLRVIAKREIKRHAARLESEMGIKMNIDERVYTALLFSEGANADARTIRGRAEAFFNDELYELLRLVASDKVGADIPALSNISISLDLAQSLPGILVQVTEAGVKCSAAPALDGVVAGLVNGVQDGLEVLDRHSCGDQRLVTIAQDGLCKIDLHDFSPSEENFDLSKKIKSQF